MFYVPKAIKAIFLSALIGTISVQQSHQFPWGFPLKCAFPFLFIFTLQPVTKGGSESAYKWAGERPSDQARWAWGGKDAGRGPWLPLLPSAQTARAEVLSFHPGMVSGNESSKCLTGCTMKTQHKFCWLNKLQASWGQGWIWGLLYPSPDCRAVPSTSGSACAHGLCQVRARAESGLFSLSTPISHLKVARLLRVWFLPLAKGWRWTLGGERERFRRKNERKNPPKPRFGIMDTPGWCYIFCVSLLFKAFGCKSLFQLIGKWCWKTCFSGTIFFISY